MLFLHTRAAFNASAPALTSPSAMHQFSYSFPAQPQQLMMMPNFPQQQQFVNPAAPPPVFAMPPPQGMYMDPFMMYNMQAAAMLAQQRQQQQVPALISPTPDRYRLSSSSTPKVVDDATRFVFPPANPQALSAQPQPAPAAGLFAVTI